MMIISQSYQRNMMRPNPLIDQIGSAFLAIAFLILLLLQWRFPLRRQQFSVLRRLFRNYIMSIPGFVILRLAMLPIPIALSIWAQHRHIGLLNWMPIPRAAAIIVS